MKPLFLICQLMIAVTTLGQSNSNQLQFKGSLKRLGIGNDGSLTLSTEDGEVGFAGSMKGGWHRADAISSHNYVWGVKIETPSFFNKDTGFVSGFTISKKNKYDLIYRTTDGGEKWTAVKFGQSGYVEEAVYNDKGEAWLSVAYSGIAYTKDYGLNWKKFKNPNVKQRFKAIFFTANRQGLIASTDNLLYYTPNNCRTWKKLPTPLDQKKYSKTNRWSDADFNRVAIFKDHFLVVQEGMVFYTKRDSINWVWLPDYCDLYTDYNSSALFFKRNRDHYVRVNDNFKPVHTLNVNGYDAICKNSSLFVLDHREVVQLTPANDTVISLFEKARDIIEPVGIGFSTNGTIGYLNNKLFVQKDDQGPWDSLCTLPMLLDVNADLDLIDDSSVFYQRGDDSLFYFDLTGHLQKKTSKNAMITSFIKSGIKQVAFSRSSFSGLMNAWDKLQYTNLGNEFGNAVVTSSIEYGIGMPDCKDQINASDVYGFINQFPAMYNSTHMVSLKELGVTENDYIQCKKDIQEFRSAYVKNDDNKNENEDGFVFPRNNLDFDRLLSLVDTIQQMDNKRVYDLLDNLIHFHSTTINSKKITFINNDNEVLSISNSYSGLRRAFYFPWYIELNGCRVKSIDVNIVRFIEKVYPAFWEDLTKVQLLHELVKRLY